MIKAILFDCGGVFVYPTTGDWVLGPGFEAVLGADFMRDHLQAYRTIRAKHIGLLPDTNCMETDEEEYLMFMQYYDAVFAEMGISLTDEQIETLARAQVYRDDRYGLFDDVLPWLARWHESYKLGIVSDAPPSTRRILDTMGVMRFIDGATFSCNLGILKPDTRIYQSTLDMLDIAPEEAVFIDDFPSKLSGAKMLGIHCVQMRRPMPAAFNIPAEWEGPVVHSFSELDAHVKSL